MIAKEAEGFGISEPKQAEKKMAAQSDGVIVGSAIVKLCEKYGADCVPHFHVRERDEGRNPVERTCVENGKICERPVAEQTRRFCNIYYERLFTEKISSLYQSGKASRLTGQEMR